MKEKGIIFDWIGTLSDRHKGVYSFSEEVLRKLSTRYNLGLITLAGSGIDQRKRDLEESGILHYFDSVIVDTAKTPEQYLECMKELGITSDLTFVVDDRTIRGIMVGNKLGCTTIWIQKGEYEDQIPNKETGEPSHKINSIKELLDIL